MPKNITASSSAAPSHGLNNAAYSGLQKLYDGNLDQISINDLTKLKNVISTKIKRIEERKIPVNQYKALLRDLSKVLNNKSPIQRWEKTYPRYFELTNLLPSTSESTAYQELFKLYHEARKHIETKYHYFSHNSLITRKDDALIVAQDFLELLKTNPDAFGYDGEYSLSYKFISSHAALSLALLNRLSIKRLLTATTIQIRYALLKKMVEELSSQPYTPVTESKVNEAQKLYSQWVISFRELDLDSKYLRDKFSYLRTLVLRKKSSPFPRPPQSVSDFMSNLEDLVETKSIDPHIGKLSFESVARALHFTTPTFVNYLKRNPPLKTKFKQLQEQYNKYYQIHHCQEFIDKINSGIEVVNTIDLYEKHRNNLTALLPEFKNDQETTDKIHRLIQEVDLAEARYIDLAPLEITQEQALQMLADPRYVVQYMPKLDMQPNASKFFHAMVNQLHAERHNPTGFRFSVRDVCNLTNYRYQLFVRCKTPELLALFELTKVAEHKRRLNYLLHVVESIEKNPEPYTLINGYEITPSLLQQFASISRHEYVSISVPTVELTEKIVKVNEQLALLHAQDACA